MCVCVCVCVRERDRQTDGFVCVCVCVCVCVLCVCEKEFECMCVPKSSFSCGPYGIRGRPDDAGYWLRPMLDYSKFIFSRCLKDI